MENNDKRFIAFINRVYRKVDDWEGKIKECNSIILQFYDNFKLLEMSSYEVIKIVYLYIESFLNKKTEKVNFNVHFYKKIYNYFVYDDWII